MKKRRCFLRTTLFYGLLIVLCFGLFVQPFPIKTASAAGDGNVTGNSGGFIVEADKVEGSMNPVSMAAGDIDMGEGKIYGLTITKVLQNSKPGALIIKIKSQGPIPVKNLKGKLMGLPQFSNPCLPSQLGWLCLQSVKMKLSEQTVGSISLPNATIETCFEGQCAAVDPNIDGKDPGANPGDGTGGLGSSITDMTKQLDQLTDLLNQTKDLQDVIDGGKDTLQKLINKAEGILGLPDQLEPLTKQIGDGYKQLIENVNQLVSLIGSSDQLLNQVTGLLTQGNQAELVKSLGQNLQELTDRTKGIQDEITALKNQQLGISQNLNGVKEDINGLKGDITNNKGQYTKKQLQNILHNLGSEIEAVIPTTPASPSTPLLSIPVLSSPPTSTGNTTDENNTEPGTTPTTGNNSGNTNNNGGGTGTGTDSGTGTGTGTVADDPTAELQKQLANTIENGKKLVNAIQPNIVNANQKMDDMNQLSGLLVGVNLLLVNILNKDKADQYQADLNALQGYIDNMAGPVQQLKDTISRAEDLQNQLGQTNPDLQNLKDELAQVKAIKTRLQNESKKKLINLPLLNIIQEFVEQIDAMTEEIDGFGL